MAEKTGDGGEKKPPPKIKLGIGKELEKLTTKEPAKAGTSRIDLSKAQPPPEKADEAEKKKSTSRLDVSAAEPAPRKSPTSHIDISQAQPPKRQTTRIDLSKAQPAPPKKGTTRIDPSKATPPQPEKARTSRLDISKAVPPDQVSDKEGISSGIPHDASKSATMRVDVSPTAPAEPETVLQAPEGLPEAAKYATQRIELEEEPAAAPPAKKGSALKTAAEVEEIKKRTSRIDMPETIDEKEDVLKRRTRPLGIGTAPAAGATEAPKTIRIKRPDSPATKVLPKQPVPQETGVKEAPSAADVAQAKKSETARLDLPPEITERPSTRPKTIRIKRPDGTTARKPLAIARAAGATEAATDEKPEMTFSTGQGGMEVEEAEEVGTAFVVLAVIGLLVGITLLYVLLGQTYALDLPFYGRI